MAGQEINQGVGFVLGGLAGIVGASAVFPMDSIKTRLQNQRGGSGRAYKGIVDCGRQVIAREGLRGLYRGLPAQWVGIGPEKAVKLGSNTFLRRYFRDRNYAKGQQHPNDTARTFRLTYPQEMIAGGLAGLAHVGVTSPYEMVKIRLQLSAESGATKPPTLVGVVREIGLRNMFRGSSACLLRDVSFSVVYFGLYHPLRHYLGNGADPTFSMQLLAGTAAGSLASSMSTPFDVVKTRLQAQQQQSLVEEILGSSAAGSTSEGAARQVSGSGVAASGGYRGVVDCVRQIVRQEGVGALFHGITPRLLIISPLFGITFLVYENLVSGWLYFHGV